MTDGPQAALIGESWLSRFGDNEIRAELRKLVERERSSVLKRLAAAQKHFESETETSPAVGGGNVQMMHKKFEAAASDAVRTYDKMLEFIDRP